MLNVLVCHTLLKDLFWGDRCPIDPHRDASALSWQRLLPISKSVIFPASDFWTSSNIRLVLLCKKLF